jgi:hypothetical protein
MLNRRVLLAGLAGMAGGVTAGVGARAVLAQDGFRPLFDGTNVDDFAFIGVTADAYYPVEDYVVCIGRPNGYVTTKKSYKNYVLKLDWRYARPAGLEKDEDFPGNSGLLMHIQGEHKVWPKCVEVQLMNRDAGAILPLFGAKANAKKHAEEQKKAIKPVGQWNTMEVTSKDGTVISKMNGILVAEATECEPIEGPIGLQSEGAEIHFRNLLIKEL